MGIGASYRRLTLEEFEKLKNDAAYASLYFGDDLDTDEDIYAYYDALELSDRYLDLDKYWQSLYFLLTGYFPFDSNNDKDSSLFHKVFYGGTATPWEATYGMVRYLTVREVNEIAEALDQFSEDDFKLRLDGILASNENSPWLESFLFELRDQFVEFFNPAAREGNIVLLSLD